MNQILEDFFKTTAWVMKPPHPYSAFHILLGAVGILTAVFLARRLAEKPASLCIWGFYTLGQKNGLQKLSQHLSPHLYRISLFWAAPWPWRSPAD